MFLPSFSRRIRGCCRCEVARIIVQNPIANGLAADGTAMSNDGKELYVSTGRGNAVAVIDTQKNDVATTISVGNRA